LTNRPSHL
jgi:cathepsin D